MHSQLWMNWVCALSKTLSLLVLFYVDELDVHSQLVLFYQGLYEETKLGRPTMDGLDFACIEEEERLSLEKEFTEEEVTQVLREMESDKAPSLDGFTMAFFSQMLEYCGKGCHGFF